MLVEVIALRLELSRNWTRKYRVLEVFGHRSVLLPDLQWYSRTGQIDISSLPLQTHHKDCLIWIWTPWMMLKRAVSLQHHPSTSHTHLTKPPLGKLMFECNHQEAAAIHWIRQVGRSRNLGTILFSKIHPSRPLYRTTASSNDLCSLSDTWDLNCCLTSSNMSGLDHLDSKDSCCKVKDRFYRFHLSGIVSWILFLLLTETESQADNDWRHQFVLSTYHPKVGQCSWRTLVCCKPTLCLSTCKLRLKYLARRKFRLSSVRGFSQLE